MGRSTEKTPASETDTDVLTEFESFNEPGYAFSPVSNGVIDWLLRRAWIIPLGIILVIILLNLTAFPIIEDDKMAIDLAYLLINQRFNRYRFNEFYVTESNIYIVECNPDESADPSLTCITKNTEWTTRMVTDSVVYLIPLFSIILFASILYTIFVHRAPKTFYWLAKIKRLILREAPIHKPKWIQPKGSLTYVRDFENALKSPWGKIFALLFQIFILILVYFFAVQRKSIGHIQSGFLPVSIGEIFLIFVIPLVFGFLIGLALWVIIVVGIYLSWLTPTFKLRIQPYHHDRCGGLKPIGDIAMMMALIYIVPGTLLALWALRGLLGRSIPAVAYLTYSSLVITFVLSLVTFLLPMIRIHEEMERQRMLFQDKYLNKASTRLEEVKIRLRQLVIIGEDKGEKGQALQNDLELLEKLFPEKEIFRTWPFGQSALLAFAVGQTIQFIPLIAGWVSG